MRDGVDLPRPVGRCRLRPGGVLVPSPQAADHRRGRQGRPPGTTSGPARARRLREHGMSMSAAERHATGGVVVEQYLETGLQLPDDRPAGGGRAGAARPDRRHGGRSGRAQAATYQRLLSGGARCVTAADPDYGTTNYQSFWVLLPRARAPGTRSWQPWWPRRSRPADHGVAPGAGVRGHVDHIPLPVTERLTHDSLVLPLHHELTDRDQERIVDVLLAAVGTSVS